MKKKGPKHVTPPSLISVTNHSKRVTDAECAKMVHAIGIQLARDVAPIWGQVPALEFCPAGAPVNGIECTIGDTPDVPGAAGYHDEDDSGIPYIRVFTFAGASALTGSDAVSVTLSHEILEVVGDSPANKWADGPDGADYAYELCDAVEGDTYAIDGVTVSNFVYPAFFDPRAQSGSKLAFIDTVDKPFAMSSGGYEIRRTEPGRVAQVFARAHEAAPGVVLVFGPGYPEHKKAGKVASAARRRGPRFPAPPTLPEGKGTVT